MLSTSVCRSFCPYKVVALQRRQLDTTVLSAIVKFQSNEFAEIAMFAMISVVTLALTATNVIVSECKTLDTNYKLKIPF